MTVFLRIVGGLLIALALRDVFHTLFHPAGQGSISDSIAALIWRTIRRMQPGWLTLAGPAAFFSILGYWTVSMITGFALIYFPELPHRFAFAAGLDSGNFTGLFAAIELSVSSLITLSSGVYAGKIWLALIMALESIVGFGLVTASVSWILSIYPILEHRKSLAHQASLLHFSEYYGIRRLRDVSDSDVSQILLGLASQLSTTRHELIQFPITYYFHESEEKSSLAATLPYLADIADQNKDRTGGAALAATVLGGAVDDYLEWVAESFLDGEFQSREQILRALAEDHLRQPLRAPERISKAA